MCARPCRMNTALVTVTPYVRGRALIDPEFRAPLGDDIEGPPISFYAQVSTAGKFNPLTPSRQGDTEPVGGHLVYRLPDSGRDNVRFRPSQDDVLGAGAREIRKGDVITSVQWHGSPPQKVRWEITGLRPRAYLRSVGRGPLLIHIDFSDKADERGEIPGTTRGVRGA